MWAALFIVILSKVQPGNKLSNAEILKANVNDHYCVCVGQNKLDIYYLYLKHIKQQFLPYPSRILALGKVVCDH